MAMSMAEEIMDNIPASLLDSAVEDIDIAKLAREMTKWQELAPFLGLTPDEEEEIVERYRYRLQLQKREALRKWKGKHGREATYRSLITILCKQDRADLADTLKTFLLTPIRKPAQSVVSSSSHCPPTCAMTDIFHDYLVDCYSSLPHPSSLQWPTTMTSNQTYVELNLVDVPPTQNDPNKYSPITLKSLFRAGNSKVKRKVILIEGIAGAGKTTLSWYAFKEWAVKRLFEHFKLLIHVDLSDPSIHSATKLSDLIPYPIEKMRTNIAEGIVGKYGKSVCFWFGGCDEAPPSLWGSFLNRFISGSGGRAMLPNAHIVLTSRSETPLNLHVTAALTGKVIINGFHSLDRYFAACSPNNGAQLIEALKMKPELYSLCHLPLNASILAYIYDSVKDDLPTTRTGLFYPLIQNVIVRHMLSRTHHQDPDTTDFPANLPDDIRSSLDKVSKLAFENIIHRRKVFDRNIFIKCGLNSTKDALGFLRACTQFTMYGPTKQFSFTHLSFQEFLAAFHISQLNQDKQKVAIKIIFDQYPYSPVLAFYAGLTKLGVEKVREVYFNILSKPFDASDIVRELQLPQGQDGINLARDPRRQLLCLVNGLYEAQNERLFACVVLDSCAKNYKVSFIDTDKPDVEHRLLKEVRLLLSFIHFYPTDCLSLGYFVRHACSRTKHRVYLDLSCAILGDMEIKALMHEMHKPASTHNVHLDVTYMTFSSDSLASLSTLFNPCSCLIRFDASSKCFPDIQLAMKYLIEGIVRSNCIELALYECSIQSLHYLILMLSCQCLQSFVLGSSPNIFTTSGALHLFSEALKHYGKLKSLDLGRCHINNEHLMLLGTAICHKNCVLEVLQINNNVYTEDGLTYFFRMMLLKLLPVYLTNIAVDYYNDEHKKIVSKINFRRKRLSPLWPHLVVRYISKQRSQDQYERYDHEEVDKLLMRYDLAFQNIYH